MVGLRHVKVSIDAKVVNELGGGHENVVKDVEFLDLVVVKEYGEGVVKQHNDTRVVGDEGLQ